MVTKLLRTQCGKCFRSRLLRSRATQSLRLRPRRRRWTGPAPSSYGICGIGCTKGDSIEILVDASFLPNPTLDRPIFADSRAVISLRSRTRPWSGSRAWRRSGSRCGCWSRRGSCRSENGTQVSDNSCRVRIHNSNTVKNVEGTAEIYTPVTSSICRSDDCAPLTNSRSVVCIRERNVP